MSRLASTSLASGTSIAVEFVPGSPHAIRIIKSRCPSIRTSASTYLPFLILSSQVRLRKHGANLAAGAPPSLVTSQGNTPPSLVTSQGNTPPSLLRTRRKFGSRCARVPSAQPLRFAYYHVLAPQIVLSPTRQLRSLQRPDSRVCARVPACPRGNTNGHSSTYLAMGFANVRAGTRYERVLEYLSRYGIR